MPYSSTSRGGTRPLEVYLGGATVLFGLHLLNPLTNALATYRAWSVMNHVFSEPVWGVVITLAGAFQVIVAYKMLFTRIVFRLTIRECAALTMFCLWGFLALFVGLSAWDSPAITTFVARSIGELWIFLQLRRPRPVLIQQ